MQDCILDAVVCGADVSFVELLRWDGEALVGKSWLLHLADETGCWLVCSLRPTDELEYASRLMIDHRWSVCESSTDFFLLEERCAKLTPLPCLFK